MSSTSHIEEDSHFMAKVRNAGCPRCASTSLALDESFKVSCAACGKESSRGVLEDWIFLLNSVIRKCQKDDWPLYALWDRRPPFFLGKIAKDRQGFLSQEERWLGSVGSIGFTDKEIHSFEAESKEVTEDRIRAAVERIARR